VRRRVTFPGELRREALPFARELLVELCPLTGEIGAREIAFLRRVTDCRFGALFDLQLRFQRRACGCRLRFRGRRPRQVEDQPRERALRIRRREGPFERQQADIELGAERVELALRPAGEMVAGFAHADQAGPIIVFTSAG